MRSPSQVVTDMRDRLEGIRGINMPDERRVTIQRRGMLAASILPPLGLVFVVVQVWGWGVGVRDLAVFGIFYVVAGLGISVGYHRLLTHKSFDCPNWVRVWWAFAGSLAVQGAVIDWVATHRRHHAYSDQEGDPHSPHLEAADGIKGVLRGLYHAHLGWMFEPSATDENTWAPDLVDNPGVAWVSKKFGPIVLFSFFFPGVVGGVWAGMAEGSLTAGLLGALTATVWGGVVRIFLFHHVTWSVNSICHFYGTRPFDSHDESRNNPILALFSFGEGWHNAHHAFPASARHGLRWWEFDMAWLTIKGMDLVGMARNVKLPSPTQMARKKLSARAAAGV